MSPFLEKLVSFFMIESPDPDDPYDGSQKKAPAGLSEAPPVQPAAPPAPEKPAEHVTLPPVHHIDASDLEKPAPAAQAKPADAEPPYSAEKPAVQDAQPAMKKTSAKRRTEPKPAAPAVPAVPADEPAEPETEPAAQNVPADAPAAQGGGFREKLKSFFFPSDADDESQLAMPGSREGRRPVGTRVRMASHRFTTVTEQTHSKHADGKPLNGEYRALLELAKAVRKNAYAQYSGFKVGAALRAASGQVYFGVNVENASYPAGICAERAAFTAAVTAGEREFTAIAICGGDDTEPCFPCGICRQVLMELCPPDMPVVLESGVYRLDSLLPHAFQFTR